MHSFQMNFSFDKFGHDISKRRALCTLLDFRLKFAHKMRAALAVVNKLKLVDSKSSELITILQFPFNM